MKRKRKGKAGVRWDGGGGRKMKQGVREGREWAPQMWGLSRQREQPEQRPPVGMCLRNSLKQI